MRRAEFRKGWKGVTHWSLRMMISMMILMVGLLFGASSFAGSGAQQGYYRFPAVHGDNLVFTAENDLWKVSLKGGAAQRLTTHPGMEMLARFSPDGKWIAFSGNYDGGFDVYVIPASGGMPRRLTYEGGPDFVVGWLPDSSGVLFRSLRKVNNRGWFVHIAKLNPKGLPPRLRIGHASFVSFSPNKKKIAFTRYAREFRTWKRYTGGRAQDIWIGSAKKLRYRKLTSFPGTDAFPLWHKNGRIFFVSDRSGERNIFSLDPTRSTSKKTTKSILQHTFHKGMDVRWPTLQGNHLVYQLGADLWLLDTKTNRTKKLKITLPTDSIRKRGRFVSAMRYLQGYDLGAKGQRILLNARGKLFHVPAKEGVRIDVAKSSSSRVKNAAFSFDGKQIVAISDKSGEERVTLFDTFGEKAPISFKHPSKAYLFWPKMSPNGKKIAVADKNLRLWIIDVKTKKYRFVRRSAVWEIRDYKWSPDSRYLAYVDNDKNEFRSIFLYDAKKNVSIRATHQWADDSSPSWSVDGKFLYFLSRREINPLLGGMDFASIVNETRKIYVLTLQAKERAPFALKDALLFKRALQAKKAAKKKKAEAKKAAKKKKAEAKKKKAVAKKKAPTSRPIAKKKTATTKKAVVKVGKKLKVKKGKMILAKDKKAKKKVIAKTADKAKGKKGKKAKKKVVVKIDLRGLIDRVTTLPGVQGGEYYGLTALKGKLLVVRAPAYKMKRRHRSFLRKMVVYSYNLKSKKMKPFLRGVSGYSVSSDKKFMLYKQGTSFRVLSTGSARAPKGRKGIVKLGRPMVKIDPAKEWKQIFFENWRWQRDFFWAGNLAKINWKAIGKRYAKLLDRVLTRSDLNDLIGQSIGELGTSHTYVWGGDYRRFSFHRHGALGADLSIDKRAKLYRFRRILRAGYWAQDIASPLAKHHLKVRKGTYLLAINGVALKAKDNYFSLLQGQAGKNITLLVNNKPRLKGAHHVVIKALNWRQEKNLRYHHWVESRRLATERLSRGRVAYIHLPNMSTAGLIAFYRMWYPQLHKRAMLIDVRGNGGGFVSQLILQKLMRRLWAFFKARNAPKSMKVPSATFHGHLAVVTNQNAGSDGDIFCQSFQFMKLGPVFGTRTWGGVVGIRANKRFVDWGMTTQPEYAWWSPKIGWSLENKGITPDVEVDNAPRDVEKGNDRQLKMAVKYLMKRLKQDPKHLPKPPRFSNKSVQHFRKQYKKWQAKPALRTRSK